MKVKISYERIQDGAKDISEYEGHYGKVNASENISFAQEESATKHLLKITDNAMRWIRSMDINGNLFSDDLEFAEGRIDSTEYATPHGSIRMEISTKKYRLLRNKETGLPYIELEYMIRQAEEVISEYKVSIKVYELRK